MRGNLWDDPRVAKIVDLTDSSEAAVIGALYWLWATADQHTEDGVMPGLTLRSIDRKTGVKGFADALCAIGWLSEKDDSVCIIDFEKHNGSSSKKRLDTARRVAAHRVKDEPEMALRTQRELISVKTRQIVLDRDGHSCVYCGRKEGHIGPTETRLDGCMHLDHVVPVSHGGSGEVSNLVTSCRKCNMEKGDRTPAEWGVDWPVTSDGQSSNKSLLQNRTSALAREEKRREEKEKTGGEREQAARHQPAHPEKPGKPSAIASPPPIFSLEFREFISAERPDLDAPAVWLNFCDHYPADRLTTANWRKWVRREMRGPVAGVDLAAPAGVSDPDSRRSVETLGVSLGLGLWDELKQPWAAYKARVRSAQSEPVQ